VTLLHFQQPNARKRSNYGFVPIALDFLAVRAQGVFMSRQFRINYEEAIIQKNGFLGNPRDQDVMDFDQPPSPVDKDK
jgi:hypothetical protein